MSCGVPDLQQILDDYKILFNLKSTDEYYISQSLVKGHHPLKYLPIELMPDPLDFTFEDFEITLYSELDCLLSESQGDFIIILNVPFFYMKMGNNSLIPGRILEKFHSHLQIRLRVQNKYHQRPLFLIYLVFFDMMHV